MVNFNTYFFTINYIFSRCFEFITQRTKPNDHDKDKYMSINNIDIDDIDNFVIIDTMCR